MPTADEYFSRQVPWFGDSFARLRRSVVGVVGLGNIGGPVCVELGRAGIGAIVLIDNGVVEAANLSRGIFGRHHVDMRKTEAAREVLARVAPFTHTASIFGDVRTEVPESLFAQLDAVVLATDSWSSRAYVSAWAHRLTGSLTAVVNGGFHEHLWSMSVSVPGSGQGCLQCPHGASLAASDEQGGCGLAGATRLPDPSVSFIALQAAGHIVGAVVNCLLGAGRSLAGKMTTFDQDRFEFQSWRIAPDPTCTGHRRFRDDEWMPVALADYTVQELTCVVGSSLGISPSDVHLASEHERVATATCATCGLSNAVGEALLAYTERPDRICARCGGVTWRPTIETALADSRLRLSGMGVRRGKGVLAIAGGRSVYVVPTTDWRRELGL